MEKALAPFLVYNAQEMSINSFLFPVFLKLSTEIHKDTHVW